MNYYTETIKILTTYDDASMRKLIEKIAEKNPSIIVKAAKALEPKESWRDTVETFLKNNEFIAAIKFHRACTGIGLKESKEVCEKIRTELGM